MSSDKQTVAFLVEQLAGAGVIRSKPMFGEYGLYCDEIFVAMICDDQLFVKTSPISGDFLDDTHLAPPYPGAKNALRVPEERWDDREWLSAFVRATTAALPVPKPKPAKKPKF
jgi:TfoX/Sxy family transcriptional regulator of competence genes